MTESDFWRDDVSRLKAFGIVKRIEDVTGLGTSDVVYALRFEREGPARFGWIELKRLPHWPVRATTLVMLPHFTIDQVNFLEAWGRVGAGAFLLTSIERDYLLFPWRAVREIQDGVIKERMRALAIVINAGQFPTGRVLKCLTQ